MVLKSGFYPLQTTHTSQLPPIPQHNNNQPFPNVNLILNDVQVQVELDSQILEAQRELESRSNHSNGHSNNGLNEFESDGLVVYSLYGDDDDVVVEDSMSNHGDNTENKENIQVQEVVNLQPVVMMDLQQNGGEIIETEEEVGNGQLNGGGGNDELVNMRFTTNEFGFIELLNPFDEDDDSSDSDLSGSDCIESENSEEEDSSLSSSDDSSTSSEIGDSSSGSSESQEDENNSEDDELVIEEEIEEEGSDFIQDNVQNHALLNGDEEMEEEDSVNSKNEEDEKEAQNSPQSKDSKTPSHQSCSTCGFYALKTEFYDSTHCSYECTNMTNLTIVQDKINNLIGDDDNDFYTNEDGESFSRESLFVMLGNEISNGNINDLENFHYFCTNGVKRVKLENKLENPFRLNDLLEAIDPEHQSLFCPVKVVEIIGYRIYLKFIGYHDKYNFWVNADSENIFPVGWATETYGNLHFSTHDSFISWKTYINSNPHTRVSPKSNFPHINNLLKNKNSPKTPQIGMKLEAIDIRSKSNLVCVATVSCVMGDRFLIHFDSWDSLYDYWVEAGDFEGLYPVGYCLSIGVDITPPHCYESPSDFNWPDYLSKTNSIAMPTNLFDKSPNYKPQKTYKISDQLEVIDKRSPRLLRKATVINISKNTLKLRFDNLEETYDYEVNINSPDIHDIGWSKLTNHPLSTDDDVSIEDIENNEYPVCPNHKVCKSVGSYKNGSVGLHTRIKDCSYNKNYLLIDGGVYKYTDRVVVFEDKFYDFIKNDDDLGVNCGELGVFENKMIKAEGDLGIFENKTENETGEESLSFEEPEILKPTIPVKIEIEDETPEEELQNSIQPEIEIQQDTRRLNTIVKVEDVEQETTNGTNIEDTQQIQTEKQTPPTTLTPPLPPPTTTSSTTPLIIPKHKELLTYTHTQISSLVHQICSPSPTSSIVANKFKSNLIDGESFLMLTQSDITDCLGIKLGPAIKIFNVIRIVNGKK